MKTFNKILIFIIIILIVITIPTAIIINNELKSNKQLTSIPLTSIPSTSIPPTSIPSTSIPIASQSLNYLNSNYTNLGSNFTTLTLTSGNMIMSPQKKNALFINKDDGSLNLWINLTDGESNVVKYNIFPTGDVQSSLNFNINNYGNFSFKTQSSVLYTYNFSTSQCTLQITDDTFILQIIDSNNEIIWSIYNQINKSYNMTFGVSYFLYNFAVNNFNIKYIGNVDVNSSLVSNDFFLSSDGQVALFITANNLKLCIGFLSTKPKYYTLISSNNNGTAYFLFQADGNLCFYQPGTQVIYTADTNTCSPKAAKLYVTSTSPYVYITDSNGKTIWTLNSPDTISSNNLGTKLC